MEVKSGQKVLKFLNAIAFLVMVAVNTLANVIPLNGMTTGAVSEQYPNLFTPAAYTFSVWGLIYVLLALFLLAQFGVFRLDESGRERAVKQVGPLFAVSCAANAGWIFAWHYGLIALSVLLMLALLVCLIFTVSRLQKPELPRLRDKLLLRLPFSVYFGWITVAAIANFTAYFVSIGWDGWGISEEIWMVMGLLAGLLIAVAVMRKNRDPAYGLVVFWAYLGILVKHISPSGFANGYPIVIFTVCGCMALLAAAIASLLFSKKNSIFSPKRN